MRAWIILTLILFLAPRAPGEDEDATAGVRQRCAELSDAIEKMLGKKFKAPVPVRVVDQDFIERFARASEDQLVPKEVRKIADRLAVRLKHVPQGYDVMDAQIRLLRTMVAGLYDPDKDCYYVVENRARPGSMTFDMTAAHELAHAYRDVDKDYWERVKRTFLLDEDEAIAVTCLVEGEAELVGQSVGIAASTGREAKLIVPGVITSAKLAPKSAAAAAADPRMRGFPLMLREMLVTRYLIGQALAACIYEKGGWKALGKAFDHPPRSTEQVLHPEKYIGPDVDEPTRFRGGDPAGALGAGWKTRYTNTLGEFGARVHLTERLGRRRAKRAAAGWDGARYHVCEREDAPLFFGMISTWDSAKDAAEFADAWAHWARVRDDKDVPSVLLESGADKSIATRDGLVVVRVSGKDVLVADGVPRDRLEPVFKALASATRKE
ncbi:MAG: hypothetical protein ACYTGZ_04390 [Planctomycetota bacterium]|jgi:hypothetical protein